MNIISCDLGTKSLAFCILIDGKYDKSWVVDISDENSNLYVVAHNAILEALRVFDFVCYKCSTADDFFVIEHIPLRFPTARPLVEVATLAKLVCSYRNFPYMEISPTTVKSRVLGSGKSPKDQKEKKALMVDKINEMFGLALTDHNESDACGIAFTAWLLENEE